MQTDKRDWWAEELRKLVTLGGEGTTAGDLDNGWKSISPVKDCLPTGLCFPKIKHLGIPNKTLLHLQLNDSQHNPRG